MKKIKLILFLVFTFFLLSGCENNNEIVAKYYLDDNVYDIVVKDGYINLSDIPEIDNIKYLGLYYDSDYKQEYKNEKLTKDTTFYIKYEKEYKVTYYINGEKYEITINKNAFSITDIPNYKDYLIEKLYLDNNFTNEFDGTINSDITLYAKCKKSYRVTLVYNNLIKVINVSKDVGVFLIDDVPRLDNYEILGLYLDSDYKTSFNYYLSDDTVIYVKWRVSYKVTLIFENGERRGVFYNKKTLLIEDIKLDNKRNDKYEYNYYGLYYDYNYTEEFSGVLNEDITLYVKRAKVNTLTLIYNDDTKEIIKTEKKILSYFDIPYKKGYEILGLYLDKEQKIAFDGTVDSDLTLYVNYKKHEEILTFEEYFKKNFNYEIDSIDAISFKTDDALYGIEKFITNLDTIKEIINLFDYDYGYNKDTKRLGNEYITIKFYVNSKYVTSFILTDVGQLYCPTIKYVSLSKINCYDIKEKLISFFNRDNDIALSDTNKKLLLKTYPEIPLYSITLVYDDGAIRDYLTNKNKFSLQFVPNVKNYKVLGLYLDEDFTKPFDGNVYKTNLILYVKGIYTYNLTINYSDGEKEDIIIEGNNFSLDDVNKSPLYNYYGMYTDCDFTTIHNGEVVRNMNLYVLRKKIKKITFILDSHKEEVITDNDYILLSDVPSLKGYEILGIYLDENLEIEFNEKLLNDITLYVKVKKWDNTYLLEDVFKTVHNDFETDYSSLLYVSFYPISSSVEKTIRNKDSLNEILNMFNLEYCTKDYIDYPYDSIPLTYQIVFHYEKYDIYLKLHNSGHLSFVLYKEMDDGSRDVETEFIEYCHVCLSKINYNDTLNKLYELYTNE